MTNEVEVPAVAREGHRVRVTARAGIRLEHGDLVHTREGVGGPESGDPGADDGHPHRVPTRPTVSGLNVISSVYGPHP